VSRKVEFPGGELRYQDALKAGGQEWLDEIVVEKPKSVHVEVMDDNHIWMGIYLADGSRLMVNFYSVNGRAHIAYRCDIEPPVAPLQVDPLAEDRRLLQQVLSNLLEAIRGTTERTPMRESWCIDEAIGEATGVLADSVVLADERPAPKDR